MEGRFKQALVASLNVRRQCLVEGLAGLDKRWEQRKAAHPSIELDQTGFEQARKTLLDEITLVDQELLAHSETNTKLAAAIQPSNYHQLSAEEQWMVDKRLGILDWEN